MSGVEIAGAALALVPFVQEIFTSYSTVIKGSRRNAHLSSRLLSERARFETIVQGLSRYDDADMSPEMKEKLIKLMKTNAANLERAAEMFHRGEQRPTSVKTIKEYFGGGRELQDLVEIISQVNSSLTMVLQIATYRLSHQINDQIDELARETQRRLQRLALGENTDSSQPTKVDQEETMSHKTEITQRGVRPEQPRGQLLERLVRLSAELLVLFSNELPEYAEISNQFRLWGLAIESEGLYRALNSETQDLEKSQYRGMIQLLFRSNIRIGRVLVWWANNVEEKSLQDEWHVVLARCTAAIEQVHSELPGLPEVGMDDFSKTKRDAAGSTKAVLRTVELCIRTLRNCLPPTINFARAYPIQIEDLPASEVARLLDVSVDLIEPAAQAFKKAVGSTARKKEPKDVVEVDLDSIYNVFNAQAAILQEWKDKHRQDIELKLGENSPAKLASIADAIENITSVLLELPNALGGVVDQVPADPPPPYQKNSKDRMFISVTGEPVSYEYLQMQAKMQSESRQFTDLLGPSHTV
ncbi:hypothetical protein F5Y16DRAFT_398399 [Xylariaceae sp. FL0255]|nr:hypothetical protein F5Y16DRAFT_398399 [Xylariaceae sp. FL0255]